MTDQNFKRITAEAAPVRPLHSSLTREQDPKKLDLLHLRQNYSTNL